MVYEIKFLYEDRQSPYNIINIPWRVVYDKIFLILLMKQCI